MAATRRPLTYDSATALGSACCQDLLSVEQQLQLLLALLPRVRNWSRGSVDPLVEGLESVDLDCWAAQQHPPLERERVGVGLIQLTAWLIRLTA